MKSSASIVESVFKPFDITLHIENAEEAQWLRFVFNNRYILQLAPTVREGAEEVRDHIDKMTEGKLSDNHTILHRALCEFLNED
jgi:hypothetical protein